MGYFSLITDKWNLQTRFCRQSGQLSITGVFDNRPNQAGGEVSPRKSAVQSACQYDVTSRVSAFQNGEQSVHRRDE